MAAFESIVLPQEDIEYYEGYRKSFGPEWVARGMRSKRAQIYRSQFLEQVAEKSNSVRRNCVHSGVTVWRRKDGQPVTEDDISAVKAHDMGQDNTVIAKPGDMEITHKWYCDSGD